MSTVIRNSYYRKVEMGTLTQEQLDRAITAGKVSFLAGEPCVACAQPAYALLVKEQRIRHIDHGLADCDAGAR